MMKVLPTLAITITIDSQKFVIKENDFIANLVYKTPSGTETISGNVRVIDVTTSQHSAGSDKCPPEPFFNLISKVSGIIIDKSKVHSASLSYIPIADIISISSVETPDPNTVNYDIDDPDSEPINDVIQSIEDGGTMKVSEGIIETPLDIEKSIKLKGASAGITQNRDQEVE